MLEGLQILITPLKIVASGVVGRGIDSDFTSRKLKVVYQRTGLNYLVSPLKLIY